MAVPRHCRRWRAVEAGAAVFKTMCMLATSDRGRRGEDEDEPSVSKHIGVIINDVSAQSTSQRYKPYAAACLSHVYKGTSMRRGALLQMRAMCVPRDVCADGLWPLHHPAVTAVAPCPRAAPSTAMM